MKKLICILCPKGCHLEIDEANGIKVSGNGCPRGARYGEKEVTAPVRTITSTVKIAGAPYARCPVKTDGAIPKNLIPDIMKLLDKVELMAPVHCGDIVVENVFNTGANIVVTRSMEKVS